MDHSGLLIEYLDDSKKDLSRLRDEEPAAAGADTLPAWRTEVAAPSFGLLAREQGLEIDAATGIDTEVERFIDGALVEQSNEEPLNEPNIGEHRDDDAWQSGDSLEVDLLYLEPSAEVELEAELEAEFEAEVEVGEAELTIDIDLVTDEEHLRLDVAIALNSDSHIWEGLDGETGVFLATYQTLPIGTQVHLTVHLLDHTFEAPATVRWVRNENTGIWPGLGLELDVVTDAVTQTIARFGHIRPALFHCF